MSTFKWWVYLRSHNKENWTILVTGQKWKENLLHAAEAAQCN